MFARTSNERIKSWMITGALAGLALFILLVPIQMDLAMSDEAEAASGSGDPIFVEQKCNMCHAVSSAGIEAKMKSDKMKASDLTGVTSRREPTWIKDYLIKKVQLDGADHKAQFKGSEEELEALIAWLGEQSSEGE